MSYILDALKKSEQERQSKSAPSLQTIHRTARMDENQHGLLYYLLILLVILLIVAVLWVVWYQYQNWPAERFTEFDRPQVSAENSNTEPEIQTQSTQTPVAVDEASTASAVQEPQAPPLVLDFWELPENIKSEIPAMTFSFHVYSENPERRTIIINNKRLREGDRLSENLVLRQITQEGVIMTWRERYFQLSVVEDWE